MANGTQMMFLLSTAEQSQNQIVGASDSLAKIYLLQENKEDLKVIDHHFEDE